ncbi:MAG: ABC transporter permease [Actinobacteria bacterium 13_1_40CM_2_66_13]|nr:MAG: ABC transporter permease [Chloroflexi bacterium 13_1_40CM_66_19]OLD54352.1 MAG: ABC transporter permease [Actinobacteria bacterium 13_1_40CM_2_66_13]OLE72638.1 MAG: ABC transporter permease [Actinobacteria bacterium 13_1_20CM_2_66_18]TMF32144.1 MAG: ABC transporter permease subunit [Chloroflexota bacterium]TMG60845.1 MAG: ABC transporter permease subunit [Chloroflexota bacterium]
MGGRRFSLDWVGAVPYLVYVGLFLILPSVIIGIGALLDANNAFTLDNFRNLSRSYVVKATIDTTVLSAITAFLGAVFGALLAYAIVTGSPNGILRRLTISASGVLAQFGGVTLAFAFIASIGPAGFVYLFAQAHGFDFYKQDLWLFEIPGLDLVYLYFQIPLMVLVFLPALDGIKPQWREAAESLGGNTWHYWRHVAGPLLFPAFLGSVLLLFANAFSAYATANALINQGQPVLAQQIAGALSSEVGAYEPGFAKAIAIEMIIIVTLVTVLYTLLQRRTARWL